MEFQTENVVSVFSIQLANINVLVGILIAFAWRLEFEWYLQSMYISLEKQKHPPHQHKTACVCVLL